MPVRKDLKRLVRARMRKTGESYTAARARLLEKKREKPTAGARAPGAPAQGDLAALAGMSDATVAKRTGRAWKEWAGELDRAGAAALAHGEIATLVHERYRLDGWWTQMVTVGYERIRGLREKGQRRDGTFEVSKSRTYPVPVAELWKVFLRCREWLEGETLRMSSAAKHKTMRMKWSDGTPVEAYFQEKGPTKSVLDLQHRKLTSRAESARLRTYWSERLVAIGDLLERPNGP
ncbi:MAG: hypothetical protein L0323_18140 [Planctomycetes bacterium]|nr:hypothetical protein [Planctomycetota bacterium]